MSYFDISKLNEKLKELEAKTFEADFWQDQKKAEPILKEIKIIKPKVVLFDKVSKELSNLEEMNLLLQEEIKSGENEIEANLDLVKELLNSTKAIEKELLPAQDSRQGGGVLLYFRRRAACHWRGLLPGGDSGTDGLHHAHRAGDACGTSDS